MELYAEIHPGPDPPLLLVHGILSSRAQWRLNLAALQAAARPVVVELWGHGRSPTPRDALAYHPSAYLDQFERLRRRLGVERWVVCGQSFGAGRTLRYALEHPDRVQATIFTNSTSALADDATLAAWRAQAGALAAALGRDGQAALERLPIHPRHATRLPAAVQQELVADALLLDPAALALTFEHTVPELSIRARAASLRVPTLLVCGERERRFAADRRFAERTIPALEVVAAGAGHAVNIEAAAAFDRAVIDFVRARTGS